MTNSSSPLTSKPSPRSNSLASSRDLLLSSIVFVDLPRLVEKWIFFGNFPIRRGKSILLSGVISLTGLGVALAGGAIAQEQADCFMHDSSGNVINLTQSVCGLAPEELPVPTAAANTSGAFLIPIKTRRGGSPIVEVTFNGNQTYEMVLDTGATGTLITQEMAEALNVIPFGEITATIADGSNVQLLVGAVGSISAGGLTINQLEVSIAPPEKEIGLLGQDFFGSYDMTIKEDVVELRARGS